MAESSIDRIGEYELLEAIGEGAEGRVYRARRIGDPANELVALKRLRSTGQDKETLLFKRQTEILSKLDHPNIIRYKDSFIWREDELGEEVFCLVTELLEGQSVKVLLESHPKGLPWAQASGILHQTLSALQYASKLRVVHRDLKLSNLYITRQGSIKIIDFGIARDVDSSATTTSASGNIKGSFDYMAPDFVHQEGVFRGDEQSDVFSFGVCLFQVLTGNLPFPPLGGNPLIGYVSRWHAPRPPEPDFRHSVFSVLSHAANCIRKCLAVDRKVRYRTFTEVMTDFSAIRPRTLRHGTEVYEYVEYLGKGGFGRVFRARRTRDGFDTAIKEMLADRNASRFVREAKILQAARHPNLVQYLDFVEVEEQRMGDQRRLFLVLEYLRGMPANSLRERIRGSDGGMDPHEVLTLFAGYLDCLEHLHQRGIIHRDIKPGNLYAPEGDPANAKIFDLGIAHDAEGTKTHGQVPGTLDFMPPEFALQSGDRGSAQSDIYSMGITLYQALTKKLPFPRLPEKESDAWVAFYQRSEKPPECSFEHPVFKAHPELVKLVRRSLAPDPKQRQSSAGAMRDEIQRILEDWEKKAAFEAAMRSAREAVAEEDYREVERHANRALELKPGDATAQALLTLAREKLRQGAFDEDEAVTMAGPLRDAHEEDATAATLPADLDRLQAEIERAEAEERAREQAAKQEQERREREEQEKLEQARLAKIEAEKGEAAKAEEQAKREQAEKQEAERREKEKALAARREQEKLEQAKRDAENAKLSEEARRLKEEKEQAERTQREAEEKKRQEEARRLQAEQEKHEAERREQERIEKAKREEQEKVERARREEQQKIERAKREEEAKKREEEARRLKEEREKLERARKEKEDKERREREERERIEREKREAEKRAEAARKAELRAAQMAKLKRVAPRMAAVVAVIAVLAGGGFYGYRWWTAREAAFEQAAKAAAGAYAAGDFTGAQAQAEKALSVKSGDTRVQKIRADAQAQVQKISDFRDAVKSAQAALGRREYARAAGFVNEATQKTPDHPAAKQACDAEAKTLAVILADLSQRYATAARAARDAFAQGDYATASTRAAEALQYKPEDAEAAKLQADAQKQLAQSRELEQKFQAAIAAAREAFTSKDYVTASARATEALGFKSGDAEATRIRDDSQKQLSAIKDLEQRFQMALKAGQDALAKKDYATALAQADEALRLKPNHTEAAKIKSESGQQLAAIRAAEQKYQTALKAAQEALAKKDYATASAKAAEALAVKPNDTEATRVKTEAERQIAALKEAEQKYQTALKAAQDALAKKDYTTAATRADEALRYRPGDAAATRVRTQASELPDRERAQSLFEAGDYAQAQEVCARHSGAELFRDLTAAVDAEQAALAAANRKLGAGDYTFLSEVKGQKFAAKAPFANLVAMGEKEQALLNELSGLQSAANGWQTLQARLADASTAAVREKPPFRELRTWAEGKAREHQAQMQQHLQQLDASLVAMLDSFNVAVPSGLRPAGTKKKDILGAIGEDGKKYFRAEADKLENAYKSGGWLDQNNRATLIRSLRVAIERWE